MFDLPKYAYVFIAIAVFFLFHVLLAIFPWYRAKSAGASIDLMSILMMKFRKVDPKVIVNAMIALNEADISVSASQLEAQFMAGGRVRLVAEAMLNAKNGGIDLDFDQACAIDLAGRNVVTVVDGALTPLSIDEQISFTAGDAGQEQIRLHLRMRVCPERIVGGISQEELVQRISDAVRVSAQRHVDVDLRKKLDEIIDELVMAKLDAGSQMALQMIELEYKSRTVERWIS